MTLEGIDVSHWQSRTPSLTGKSFLIAKANEGGTPDSTFGMHVANAKAAGLVTGAYCFNRADLPIDYQVQTFIRVALGKVDLYAVDVEEESIAGSQRFSVAQARYFMERFRFLSDGLPIGLYISRSPYQSLGYAAANPDWLWLAEYGVPQPTLKCDIWQYTSTNGKLDKDRFEGTRDELLALGEPPAPPSDVETPMQLAGANRAVKLEGGHGIFTTPQKDAADLIRNTTANEVLSLIGNESDFQCVWLGNRGGYVSDEDVLAFLTLDAPADPCLAVKAELTKTKADLAVADARIIKAIEDLGGTP